MGCPDAPPFMSPISNELLGYYWQVSKKAREPFSGSIVYQQAENLLFAKYGENEFTIAFLDVLDQIESFEIAWKERNKV